MAFPRRVRVSSLLNLLAAVAAAAVLGAYLDNWMTAHYSISARIIFFVVMLLVPIAAVAIAAAIEGIGRPILTMAAFVSFVLIAFFEMIALSAGSSIGAWLTLSAGLALLSAVAMTVERPMPISRSLGGVAIGCALGVTFVVVAGVLETLVAPISR